MAMQALNLLKNVALSGLETPQDQIDLSNNIGRVLVWGGLSSGATALASFIFSRSLVQAGSWKEFVPYVFKASLTSCVAYAAVGAYALYRMATNDDADYVAESFNERVSLFAKGSTLIGLAGAGAAWAAKSATSNVQIGSLAKHSFSPFLGLGAVGSVLWLFLNWQNKQLEALN